MVVFRKRIKPSEIRWRGIAIPRAMKGMFTNPRVHFDLHDEKSAYQVELDEQFRLRCPEWLKSHPEVKANDEILVLKERGTFSIRTTVAMKSKVVSLKDLLGREIKEGKIVDIQQTATGTVAVVQSIKEIPIEQVLAEV